MNLAPQDALIRRRILRAGWLVVLFVMGLVGGGQHVQAEDARQDSLRKVMLAHPADTAGFEAGVKLAHSYFGSNLDSSYLIGQRVRDAARTNGNLEYHAEGENTLGIARLFQGRNREALVHFEVVLALREQGKDKKLIAAAANNVALAHQELGNSSLAIDFHIRSLKIKEELGDSARIRVSFNNIGLIYEQLDDYPTARYYYRKALNLLPLSHDTMASATNLYNIGVTYLEEELNDSAVHIFEQSMPLVLQLKDQRMIGLHYMLFGVIDQREGRYEKAEAGISRALRIFTELGKEDQLAAAMGHLGMNYLLTGDPARARKLCQEGLELAAATENLEKQANCLDCLHQSYSALGDSRKAYAAAMQFFHLRDSLSSEAVHKQILRKDLENDFKKVALSDSLESARAAEIVRLEYENELRSKENLTLFLIVVGGLLLGLAILFFVNNQNRRRMNQVLEERVGIRTQELEKQNDQLAEYAFINAHLLRQPLTQILGLITLIRAARTEEERAEYLELLRRSSEKLDQVIHDIRDVVEKEHAGRF